MIKSFSRDTSCGRDELRDKHLMDYLSGVVVAMSADIVSSITQVVNLFFMGNAKKKLGEYIASALLSLLVNPGGDTLFKVLRIQHKVTEQDMQDTYQPPFKSCILQGKASCVMSSYNAVYGIPTCADQKLLQKTSTEWGFIRYQNYTKIPEDVVALALKVGMDTNRGTYMLRHTKSAVDKGEVKEEVIDKALLNLFEFQLCLGLFDGDPIKGKSPVQSNKHSRRPKEIFKKTTFSSGCVDATCTSNDGFK
ncbi:probable beta-D-xylosidase 6 [Tanacetum coccineum]|uniref:Probable beta-D-xylosidase 6 n=1 Tax=Tanacetum coccineum TaxID=301880 RepID=A0ABQ5CXU2_9ASTR